MEKKAFERIKNITAIVILALSSFVYLATVEPTASFWDCGEFIASSYKLEVGHPPGNPMFQLVARFFTMFTGPEHAAAAVNSCSAMCSAFTIFFLFLTIVHFGIRLLERRGKQLTKGAAIAVLGAGAAGALAYCFSDTFWFSAVEGEVYAMSSLVTAVVFWAILKWEEHFGEPYNDRWLVFIALLLGLSIGIHLLSLLVIPVIVFIYYYRSHIGEKMTFWKGLLTLAVSGLVLALILFIIIPYVPKTIAMVDRWFVNGLGAPFNLGATILSLLIFAACFALLAAFRRKGKVAAHTITLSLTAILIGYSVFAVVVIRANANPPTNEYSPDNPYTLVRYINREQYGSKPVVFGESYKSIYNVEEGTYWTKLGDRYYKTVKPLAATYPAGAKMLFPRMWSTQSASHEQFYDAYTQGNFRTKTVRMADGTLQKTQMPRMTDNLRFFFDYQLSYMYFRYFFWNFVGRQNDLQGQVPGDRICGNWESGIGFIDRARLGDQSLAPDYLANNKGKNHYFFLPLLLGLIGLFYQLKHDGRNAWITFLLFFLTGIAIIIYLNQTPYQPRERDYAYAGSFYVFAIWIGLAVIAIKEWFDNLFGKGIARENGEMVSTGTSVTTASVASVLGVAVAVLMGCQNWDDHDRSNRYTAVEEAYNYLVSCDKDAILITHGDNDTFPLWYAQEVEGMRTDVHIMNTSLLGMDWYIDQMKCRSNQSAPLPISLSRKDYLYGTHDFVRVYDAFGRPATAQEVMSVFTNPKYRSGGIGAIATRIITVPVDKEAALANGIVLEKDADKMLDALELKIPESASVITKTDLILLDILANYKWDRPIYFVSQNGDCTFEIGKYLQFDGYAYKIVPIDCPQGSEPHQMDTDKMYNLVMDGYRFDSISDTTINFDYFNLYAFSSVTPIRGIYNQVANTLISEGRNKEAMEVLDRCYQEVTPAKNIPYDLAIIRGSNEYEILTSIDLYLEMGMADKARDLSRAYMAEALKSMKYSSQPFHGDILDEDTLDREMQYATYLANLWRGYGIQEEYDWINDSIKALAD
ncbi:MAG: DUF2723 domain-containing protein [Bacteroidales bacterium]|nr:DUF2723 domain-containing protein [Bacteroidales bacterium]